MRHEPKIFLELFCVETGAHFVRYCVPFLGIYCKVLKCDLIPYIVTDLTKFTAV